MQKLGRHPPYLFMSALLLIFIVLALGLINTRIGFFVPAMPSFRSANFDYNNFFENFSADALVAVIFGIFFPFWFKSLDKPRQVEIVNRSTMNDTIETSLKEDGDGRGFSVELAIKNTGRVALLNRIYIHLYIPRHIQYSVGGAVHMTVMGKTIEGFNYIRGQIGVPVYPIAISEFIELKGSIPPNNLLDNSIHYLIGTEFGEYPRKRFSFSAKARYLGLLKLI